MTVRFWGVRGGIPAPGPETCRYGGNTACVEIRAGEELLILDAGSGIRKLGVALGKNGPVTGTLLISHAHWDHIHGLPFFAPAMRPGNRFQVYGCAERPIKSIFAGQMETPYFPVSLDDLPDTLEFHELDDQPITVGPITIHLCRLHHPGVTLGFRVEAFGRTLVYATDHEPLSVDDTGTTLDPALLRFADGADLLICDGQYLPEEYRRYIGWGHSSVTDAVRLALQARARRLALFHHDPERTDAALEELLAVACAEVARRGGTLECLLAAEGLELTV
jgi:phosphoribosyl 1,2-cyclic phosphodiesterase